MLKRWGQEIASNAQTDAFDLVWVCPGNAIHGDRGLAIWAIGQMGKVALLDRIHGAAEALFEKDTAELRARYPEMLASDISTFIGSADGG